MTEPEPQTTPKKRDPVLRAAVKSVAVSGLVLTVLAAVFTDFRAAVGVFLGGALATANLVLFIRLGDAFLDQKGPRTPWALLGFLKLLALFGAVYLILRRGDVSALALVVGYGAMPIGITLSNLFFRKEEP